MPQRASFCGINKSQTRSYQVAALFEDAELSRKFSQCCWGGL
jgi:hypothetical protein